MSEPIQVGDLVYVKNANVCCGGAVGTIFKVTKLRPPKRQKAGHWVCSWCGAEGFNDISSNTTTVAEGFNGSRGMPITRLRRIPPFPELKDERHDEEITA